MHGVKTRTKKITEKARNREERGNVCKTDDKKIVWQRDKDEGKKERSMQDDSISDCNTQRKPNDSDSFKSTDRQNRAEK